MRKQKVVGRRAFSELEKELIRRKIINSAKQLYSEIDFNKVTMQKIADKTGISKGTIYYYFKNIADLFYVMTTEIFHEVYDSISEQCNTVSTNRDKFIIFNKTKYKYYKENITNFLISDELFKNRHIFDTNNLPSITLEKFSESLKRGHSIFNTIIQDGVRTGEFRKELNIYQTMSEYAYGNRGILSFVLINYVDLHLGSADNFYENYITNYLRILEK